MHMAGLGLCLCCKKDRLLIEHPVKKINENILLCNECISVMEEYHRLVDRYSQLVQQKDRQPSSEKNAPVARNVEAASTDGTTTLEVISDNSGGTARPATGLPDDTAEALTSLIGQYKRKRF